MQKITIILLLFFCTACGDSSKNRSNKFSEAMEAEQRGEYAIATSKLRPLADKGYVPALYRLAIMYSEGRGVPEDHIEAFKMYMKVAVSGDPADAYTHGAYDALTVIYASGYGVGKDCQEAIRWATLANDEGKKRGYGGAGIFLQQYPKCPGLRPDQWERSPRF